MSIHWLARLRHTFELARAFQLSSIAIVLSCALWGGISSRLTAQTQSSVATIPGPVFTVPGFEADMQALNELHALHQRSAFTNCTLWDIWLPHATLWTGETAQARYRQALLERRIDDEGYVAMQQHRGLAHSDGWPFPTWQQSTGVGYYFSIEDETYSIQNFGTKPLADTKGWEISGADIIGIDPSAGLQLRCTEDELTITTPAFRCGTIVAPYARLEWAARKLSPDSQAHISWLLEGETDWSSDFSAPFSLPSADGTMQYANIPLYRQPNYAGLLTRYRITLKGAAGAEIDFKSIITSIDTRHPITNAHFVRAATEYFDWTGDIDFLKASIARMRTAIEYALREFNVVEGKHVFVPWVGHNGRSGLSVAADGSRSLRPGVGVGNNYWDLLPFGAHDAMATMYLVDSLRHFAELERQIVQHPEWGLAPAAQEQNADALTQLCDEIRVDFQERFWSAERGRFVGWIDVDGLSYDYGFTFLNLEAIYCGLASPEQADTILEWIEGGRVVAGDTSQGADIYHWRFAPRATTKRNAETYVWAWSDPASIEWGNQVQDGGAVLGFSYHDLMARLKIRGADNAWERLQSILGWFSEVQNEGGYRAYYAVPGRGLLQGGGPPGGLGLDHEFMESVLVPQIMLYGFLGFDPSGDTFRLSPQLPTAWTSLTVSGIHYRGEVLDITAHADGRIDVRRRD